MSETVATAATAATTPLLTCSDWSDAMTRLIKEEKWNELVPTPCLVEECENCHTVLWAKIPLEVLTAEEFFSPEQAGAVMRMYGHYTTTEWMKLLLYYRPSIPLLRFLFGTGRLSPDQSDPFTLLSHNVVWWSKKHIDYLLSPEVGMNINLPTTRGNIAILQYLRTTYDDNEDEDDIATRPGPEDEYWTYKLECLQFLLDHGADPLLGNRDGTTALTYVEGLTTYTEQQKRTILSLLYQYA